MLRLRREEADQLTFFDQFLPPDLRGLPEDLAKLDEWLDDERFFSPFLDRYHKKLGRPSIPAETYIRIMALKHQYGLSDRGVCALVNDRITWRRFCRIPWDQPVPHPSSLTKIRKRLDADGGDHMALLNEHLVRKASEEGLVKARKIRTDTTAVEADIHHPTDASLIYDGVRTLTSLVKKVKALGTDVDFRDRSRSMKKRLLRITKVLRRYSGEAIREVRRITEEMALIAAGAIKAAGGVIKDLEERGESFLERIAGRMKTVRDRTTRIVEQALEVNAGNLHIPDRLVSIFDPDARPIRRGKPDRPTEFGYKVRITETEERLVTEYGVFSGNPSDDSLLMDGVKEHCRRTGKVPLEAVTDRGFWDPENERTLAYLGVKRVALPKKGKVGEKRRSYERQPWFRRLHRWRSGIEATISVLKRRYGLDRTLYRGLSGSKCWVGGAIWGYNLRRIAELA